MTPLLATNTAVLPPPPFSTQKLSFSFSTSTTFGAADCAPPAAGCWKAATATDPAASSVMSTMTLLIEPLLERTNGSSQSTAPDYRAGRAGRGEGHDGQEGTEGTEGRKGKQRVVALLHEPSSAQRQSQACC